MIRFARVSIPGSRLTLVLCDTLLLLSCYVLAAQWTQTADLDTYLFYGDGLLKIAIVVTSLELGLFWERLYEWLVSPARLFQQVCLVLGAAFLLQALLVYGAWGFDLERDVIVYGSVLVLVIFPLWRIAFSAVLRKAIPVRRLLFLGASPEVDRIALHLKEHPEMSLSVLGYLDSGTHQLAAAKLGSLEDFAEVVQEHAPQRIVVGTKEGENLPVRRLLEMQWNGAQVEEASMLYESLTGRVSIFSIEPSRLIFSAEFDPHQPALTLQAIYCLTLTALLIVVSSPIMLLTALLVKISSRGPLLTRERRVGLVGSPIEMLFFRTTDAGGVTAVGGWLRRLHLDKLPLLFNIARGEMSLVGPQAERPEFAAILEKNIPFYKHRHSVKPGLTGWAQIHVKDSGGLEDAVLKLEYDFFYIKNLAALLDLHILLRALSG